MDYLYFSIPIFIFANITAITPGPNNIILSTTGVNYGFSKTIPQILGVICGYLSVLTLSLLGLGTIFLMYPKLSLIMKISASGFLVYLSYKIFISKNFSETTESKPFGFIKMYFFQIINPKGVMVSLSAASLFLQGQFSFKIEFLIIFICFTFSTISSAIIWALLGHMFRKIINDTKKIILFNRIMSISLIGCVVLILI